MNIHELKSWPYLFQAIAEGRKTHELRRCDDREFKVGDILRLREFNPDDGKHSGRSLDVLITYITSAEHACAKSSVALNKTYCILSVTKA